MTRDNPLMNGELRIVERYNGDCMIVGPAVHPKGQSVREALPVFDGLWPISCWSTRKKAEAAIDRLQQLESLSLLDDEHLIENEFNARYKAYVKARLEGRSKRPHFP